MVMGLSITLSKRSLELIKAYQDMAQPSAHDLIRNQDDIDTKALIAWLSEDNSMQVMEEKNKSKFELTLASLRTSLMHDLWSSFGSEELLTAKKKKSTWSARAKFIFFAACGGVLAACEGFDSMSTMLGVLSAPTAVTVVVGLAFSALSIVVFCGFDVVSVAKELGVSLAHAPKLLDVYFEALHAIKNLRKKINTLQLATLSVDELLLHEQLMAMLQKRFAALVCVSKQFDKALNGKAVQIVEIMMTLIAALLHFGSGYFAGQSVAMFVAGIFLPAVLPSFWPVVLVSILIGIAALTLYYFVGRPELKKLVGRWFGLDEEKIEKLCDEELLNQESAKLSLLSNKIKSTIALKDQLDELMKGKEKSSPNEALEKKSDDSLAPDQSVGVHHVSFFSVAKAPKVPAEKPVPYSSSELMEPAF